jgi:hypothetical protein
MPPAKRAAAPPKKRTRREIEDEIAKLQSEADEAEDDGDEDDGPEVWEYRTHKRTGAEYRVRHKGRAAREYLDGDADDGTGDPGGQGDAGDGDDGTGEGEPPTGVFRRRAR